MAWKLLQIGVVLAVTGVAAIGLLAWIASRFATEICVCAIELYEGFK